MNELEPIIPDDWFVLNWRDEIKAGDLWLDGDVWREIGEADIDEPAIMMTTVIRKKESTCKVQA